MNKSSILNRLILTSLVSIFVAACSAQNGLPKVDGSTENDAGAPQEAGGQTDTTSEEDAPVSFGSCVDGTYDHDSNETTACLAWSECEPGTKIVGEGTTTLNRSCNACAPGTFSAERNAVTCNEWTDCPAGDFTVAPGSLTSDRQCMKCPVGKFTASPNSSACVAIGSCAPGTEQTAAASGSTPAICVPCATGTYCAGEATLKEACDANSWDHDSNPASPCVPRTPCAVGQFVATSGSSISDRTCTPCANGTFSVAANSAVCTAWSECSKGKFVGEIGTSSADRKCTDCLDGRFSDTSNAISCAAWSNCDEGKFVKLSGSTTADRSCEGCTTGTFNKAQNATTCAAWKDCPAGRFVSNIPTGVNDRVCVDCQMGTLTTVPNQSSCLAQGACAAGTEQTTAATGSAPAVCSPCAAGNYCAGGTAPKQACAGDTWDHDANPGTSCASKTQCGAGSRVLSEGGATAPRTCEACTSGYTTMANAMSCTAWKTCVSGEFMNPKGTSQTNTMCSTCSGGSYSNTDNAASCKPWDPCEPGWKVVTGSGGSAKANRQCEQCAGGSFSKTLNSTSCTAWQPCAVGWRVTNTPSATVDRNCAMCPTGEYTAQPNLQQCTPQGQCAAGTVQTAAGTGTSPPACEPCLAGTYCAGGTAPKQTCGAGGDTWDSDGNSATACVARRVCIAGTRVGNDGSGTTQRDCVVCLRGTYSNTQNSGSCANCENGYNTALGSTSCTPFTQCAAGTVQTAIGTITSPTLCETCLAGTYCAGGLAAKQPCATGTWDNDLNPSTACKNWTNCVPGQYVNTAGSSVSDQGCSPCTFGKTSTTNNAGSCVSNDGVACTKAIDCSSRYCKSSVCSAPPNLAFTTSVKYRGNLGGLVGADAKCQQRASAAGLPGSFKAWLSTSSADAASRFVGVRGWMRPDGELVADLPTQLSDGRMFVPVLLNEFGVSVADINRDAYVWTGGSATLYGTCSDWTSASPYPVQAGNGQAVYQGSKFNADSGFSCDWMLSIYCFGVDKTDPLVVTAISSRKAFVSNSDFTWNVDSGIAAADQVCQSEASASNLPGSYKAALATTSASAASRFNLNGLPWVRVDGYPFAATASALMNNNPWLGAPIIQADGLESSPWLALGADSFTSVGTVDSTCNNWAVKTGPTSFKLIYGYSVFVLPPLQYTCGSKVPSLLCLQE